MLINFMTTYIVIQVRNEQFTLSQYSSSVSIDFFPQVKFLVFVCLDIELEFLCYF